MSIHQKKTLGATAGSLRAGRYAAIDIGTVTCRMLVADIDEQGKLHDLHREYAITNLGENVDATGMLEQSAMRRVAEAITDFLRVLKHYERAGSNIVVATVATSASRDARNANDFQALLAQLGLELRIVSGKREAELSFMGASLAFASENLMVVDVGGGSTEISVGQSGAAPYCLHSFDIGCRRLTEKYLRSDPPTQVELGEVQRLVQQEMRPFFSRLIVSEREIQRMVAVAGTATSVVSIHRKMQQYNSDLVHKAVVTRAELDQIYKHLASMPLARRQTVIGLDPGRAPVMVAGLLVLRTIMDLAKRDSFTVSEFDILYGIILDAAK